MPHRKVNHLAEVHILHDRLTPSVAFVIYLSKMSHALPSHLTLRESLQKWLLNFHEASGSLDATHYTNTCFTHDITIRYGNNTVVEGRNNVRAMFEGAFEGLDYMHHEIDYFDFVGPDKLYQACTITYLVKGDDKEKDMIAIPAMLTAWLRVEEGELKAYRAEIFLDPSRVFGKMAEKGFL